jgi:hypothetical protein
MWSIVGACGCGSFTDEFVVNVGLYLDEKRYFRAIVRGHDKKIRYAVRAREMRNAERRQDGPQENNGPARTRWQQIHVPQKVLDEYG